MKLIYRVLLRLSLVLVFIMGLWGYFFYNAMLEEVIDEVDDSLEDYSENIILRSLAGETLPSISNGTNNQYYLTPISEQEAMNQPHIVYADSMVYIIDKKEEEPARILSTIFMNNAGQYLKLTVATPTLDKTDVMQQVFYWTVFLYVTLLVATILVNTLVFHRSMKPLYRLLDWLDLYTIGKQNAPLENKTNITEFRKLTEAAIYSSQRSERMYEQQKQFISNASHEIQTPVAICLNRIEMMMDKDDLPEASMGELQKLHDTLQHISKLNKSLLLLSRIDNGQFADTESVPINNIARSYLSDLSEAYEHLGIQAKCVDKSEMTVRMNETLAKILVANLIKNAFTHNRMGGTVVVSIDTGKLIVSNSGADKPLDSTRIFDRFYQGSKKEGSTGLGLAISQAICRLSHLAITYRFENGMHIFTVSIP